MSRTKTTFSCGGARRGRFFEVFRNGLGTFLGSANTKKCNDVCLIVLSARPEESQVISLATADCYNIYCSHSLNKGHHERGGAAGGRATSFVVAANGRHLCNGFE